MINLIMVAAGGAVGAVLRYGLTEWSRKITDTPFPLGTFMVNVLGCLGIGLVCGLIAARCLDKQWYPLLVYGVLGGLTTFSTFGKESIDLVSDGRIGMAGAYIVGSNAAALAAVGLGYFAASIMAKP